MAIGYTFGTNLQKTGIPGSTEDRSHNQAGELTDRTPGGGTQIKLSYDATGNLTQEGSSDGDYKYTYDSTRKERAYGGAYSDMAGYAA